MKNGIYFVTGTAGTGKSTVCRELEKRGVTTVDLDGTPGLMTWVHKETGIPTSPGAELTKEFLASHNWMCNLAVLTKLLAERPQPVVICGSCDNVLDIMDMSDQTFILVCEPEVFLPRIASRTDNEYGKSEAAKNELLGYYESYRDDCIERGAVSVDAAKPIDVVVDAIERQVM